MKHLRQWYMQEAERIITEQDEDALQEILRVRDAACALYAARTLQTTELFTDREVADYLDEEAKKPWDRLRKALEKVASDVREALEDTHERET